MGSQTIDYDALAKQYGAVSSVHPGAPAAAAVDYDALAKQYGATSSVPGGQQQVPGFWSNLWHEAVVNPARQIASGAVGAEAGANHLTANIFDLLDKAEGAVTSVTGEKKSTALKTVADWARGNQAAEERQAQQLSDGRTDLVSQVYRGGTQGVLSLPTAAVAAHVAGPVAGFAALGALTESDKGWWPALQAAAEGALTGRALQVMGPASRAIRLTGAGAMTYAQARLNGDDNTTALAKATTMGVMAGAPAGGASAKEIVSNAVDALPKVGSTLNPVEQSAVNWARGEGNIRLSAGTSTGNKGVQSLEAVTQASPLGSETGAEFRRGTETDLQRASGILAQRVSPTPANPESAGAALPAAMDRKIADLSVPRDEAYSQAWRGRNDPAYTYDMPVGIKQVPVMDATGRPSGQTEARPIVKPVNMPVDIRDLKDGVKPIVDQMKMRVAPAERNANAGFNAMTQILKADDFVPAWQAEDALSALKSMARLEPSEGVRNISQGIGAMLIKPLQDGIEAAVANTGEDALQGLRDGRALHSQIMDVDEVAKKFRGKEPVSNFTRLMQPQDIHIDLLRAAQQFAPDQMEPLGRAAVQQQFDRAVREGGFSKTQGLLNWWRDLGDETKQMVYPDPAVRDALGNLFKVADMAAHAPNPSGTAIVNSATSLNPLRIAAGYLGSKLFFTPTGIRMLTRSISSGTPIPPGGGPPSTPPAGSGGGGSAGGGNPKPEASPEVLSGGGNERSIPTGASDAVHQGQADDGASGPGNRAGAAAPGAVRTGPAAGTGTTATSIPIPGSSRAPYEAHYALRELTDVQTSHNGLNFQPNEKYGLVNDRDYTRPENQSKIVNDATKAKFDARYHITDNPDASNGPPIIDSQGNVVGGNGRGMTLQRVYANNPAGAQAYRDLLTQKAANFGLDPAQIQGMKQPVLVRVAPDSQFANAQGKQTAITDFNVKPTAELRPAEQAIADSRRVSQNTLDDIASRLDAKPDATLQQVLTSNDGGEVLRKMIGDGAINSREAAAYISKGALTEAGKARITKAVVGRFFQDPAQIDHTPAPIMEKLQRLAAPLAAVDGDPAWSLTPHVQGALDLIEEGAVQHVKNLDDVTGQSGLFGERQYSPQAVTLAKLLQTAKPLELTKAVRAYAQDASFAKEGSGLFGEPPTPADAFGAAFGK